MRPFRISSATVVALSAILAAEGAPAGELLHVNEGNRMRRIDVDTIGSGDLIEDVLIERASASEEGGSFPLGKFRDVNGMICALPDGSGRFVAGEDTGQPNPPAGWGVFSAGGRQVGKLTATYNVAGAEPFGCAFAADGRLFTTEVGQQGFGTPNGQLILWFPPYDRFPGAAGDYPNTNLPSDGFCKIATNIGTASGVAIDDDGRVYVSSSSGLSVLRFSPPFPTGPDAAGGCGSTDALGSPLADAVQREVLIPSNGLSTFSGLAFAPNGNLYAAHVLTGFIGEYDLDGQLVRAIVDPPEDLPPISTGNPQGIAVGGDGTLYYADLNLVGTFPNVGPGPNGKVRRVRFDEQGNPLPPEIVRAGLSFPDGVAIFPGDLEGADWPTYGGSAERLFFNADESQINAGNVADLEIKWSFPTGAIVTGSPAIARVSVAGEGIVRIAYLQSWDGNVYALRVRDGSELWRFATVQHDGVSFPNTASVHFEVVDGEPRVFIGSGQLFYALDAATGAEIWRFETGTGCVVPGACSFTGERNEIESSAIIADGLVVFGMDVNDREGGKGGFYAVDAADGHMVWFFDLESGQACRPLPGDDIRRYDPYHSEVELGLPAGFLASRPGCDHPRTRTGCGNVWSPPAYDARRGYFYFTSSNCDTDNNPGTLRPEPPMPPYDEAIVALALDGTPVWHWRPREVDNADLAFGAAPNLFTAVIGGVEREVLGVGNKDGTYYLLDRDGENELSGVRWDDADPSQMPYWRTNVVPGGAAGGVVATAAVDDDNDRIYFGTAPGSFSSVFNPQRPTMHALDAGSGAVLWQNTAEANADATFAPTSAIPGVVFTGAVIGGALRAYDSATGARLAALPLSNGFALAAAPAISEGTLIVGAGIGFRSGNPSDSSEITSRIPQDITAFCAPGTEACAADTPISGDSLRVVDGDGRRKRISVTSRDGAIALPQPGADDPSVAGLTLLLRNPLSDEEQSISLPAAGWTVLGRAGSVRGYRYRDRRRLLGPCKSALLLDGNFKARCVGEQIAFSLDEDRQTNLAVVVQAGAGERLCMRFDAPLRDEGTLLRRRGVFAAGETAAPPRCPLP